MTQGWGADQSRSFERVLENRLDATAAPERFELLNFPVSSGWVRAYANTRYCRRGCPPLPPDAYFLAITELAVFRTWDEHLVRLIRLRVDPKYDVLRDVVRRPGAEPTDSPMVLFAKLAPYRIPVLRELLARMKSRAAMDGALFLAALVPSLEDAGMSDRRLGDMPDLLRSLNIPFVDLRHTFDNTFDIESLRINPFDVHPNVRGHAMLADSLYTELRRRPDIWQAFAGSVLVP
jgi:hypothetical protein